MIRYLKNLAITLIGLVGWIYWSIVIFSCMITNNLIITINFNSINEFMLTLFLTIVISEILIVLLIDLGIRTKKYIIADISNKQLKNK